MVNSKNSRFEARLKLVFYAQAHGIRQAALDFGTSRNTVRRWLRRFQEGGRSTLQDLSRAPKSCPHKTPPYQEREIIKARQEVPCYGPRRLKDLFGLKPSLGAIARILRQAKLTRKPKKKKQKKNDLRAIKAQYRVFEQIQADTKHLYDIAAYWPQMKFLGLPKLQYTHRDTKSGAIFVDYANELSTTYAIMSTKRILQYLMKNGLDLKQSVLSTDNGAEYGGMERHTRQRGFHALAENYLTHRFLPPATPNAHADVETSHRSIEDEFFDLESFCSRIDFFEKVTTYQRWWNFARPNYSKGGKTPAQILEEQGLNPLILLLPPADLDYWLAHGKNSSQVGPHLPVDTEKSIFTLQDPIIKIYFGD